MIVSVQAFSWVKILLVKTVANFLHDMLATNSPELPFNILHKLMSDTPQVAFQNAFNNDMKFIIYFM